MYCPNCGRSIPDQSKFCMECGSKLPPPSTSGAQPAYRPSIPDGFQLDVTSGLYYRTTGEYDSLSGRAVTRTVYYDPVTGQYQDSPEPQAPAAEAPEERVAESAPQLPVIPEGYRLDSASGLYYKADDGVDSQGRPVRWVTYLDPDRGTFKQIAYPVSQPESPPEESTLQPVDEALPAAGEPGSPLADTTPPSEGHTPPQEEPAGETAPIEQPVANATTPDAGGTFPPPEGYILDPRSGFYYRSESGPDPATGQPAQLVTYFDTATGATKTIAYPLAPAPAVPAEGAPPVPAPPPYSYEAKKKPLGDSKIAAIVIIVLFVIVVVAAGIALGLHRSLPFFGGSEAEQSQVSQELSEPEQSQVEDERQRDKEEEESRSEELPARTAIAPGEPIESWVQFGHTSEYYMRVGEDSTHIYYLDGYSYWTQDLYRMDKTDDPVIEDLTGSWLDYGVTAFALVGNDIYFGTQVDDYRAAYYRMSKLGGNAEFLFIQEISHLVEDNGVLYFLFDEQDAVGVFRPEFDLLPELIPLARGAGTDGFLFYWDEFSVYNDWLYYGEVWSDTCVYVRFNLSTREHQMLLDGTALGEDNLYNIIYDGDTCYYNQWDDETGTNYLRTATMGGSRSEIFSETTLPSGDYLFIARVDDDLIYQQGGYDFVRAPIRTPYLGDELFTMYAMPFAITREWLFFEDEAVSLTDGHSVSLWNTIDGPRIDLEDFDLALELADMYPDQFAINLH